MAPVLRVAATASPFRDTCCSTTANDRADASGISGNHLGGANAAFVDGSVRFLRAAEINKETLDALATMDGGENIDPSEL